MRFGIPRAAESDLERREASIQRNLWVPAFMATQMTDQMEAEGLKAPGAEALRGATIDFVPVSYMEHGRKAARVVVRVAFPDRRAKGTGFMISDRLFVTNHHVIQSSAAATGFRAEFNYEVNLSGVERLATIITLDPVAFFFTDDIDGLDITVIAIGARVRGDGAARCLRLVRPVGLGHQARSGRLRHHHPTSAGAPQGGGAARERHRRALREARPGMDAQKQALLDDALAKGELVFPPEAAGPAPIRRQPADGISMQPNPGGGVTWTVPVEITVDLPGAVSAAQPHARPADPAPAVTAESTPEFADRPGYRPDFIDGFNVPLPQMTAAQKADAVTIKPERRVPGQSATELRYQHFSIVMSGARKLAYFTAFNIHGESLIGFSRKTKGFYNYNAASTAFRESLGRAEGDDWVDDPRIDDTAQTGESYYESMPNRFVDAKGHADLDPQPNFDRGHLVRRLDPCWGPRDKALFAERDSFTWTNAAPQTSAFNQGKAKRLLGQTEGRLWQGIENYVLRNAWATDSKVCVLTGPVFADDDPIYSDKTGIENVRVPLRFRKILVWQEEGDLKSLALVADQVKSLRKTPEGEAFVEDEQLALMENFLTTVAKVEKLTGFEFGDAVSQADTRFGRQNAPADAPETVGEERQAKTKKARKPAAKRTARNSDPPALRRQHALEPLADELVRLSHDAVDQLLAGRDIVDQAGDHAAGPGTGIHVALQHDARIDAGDLFADVFEFQVGAELAVLFQQPLDGIVGEHPLGVAQRPHNQPRVEFGSRDDGALDLFVHRRLFGCDEAGAHVHALGAHGQRGDQAARIGHAAGRDKGDLQLVRRARQQDHVGDVVFARMAAAFEAVDRHRIAADRLGLQGMAHRRALVDHLDAGFLELRQVCLRVAAGGFDEAHASVDDGVDVTRIVGGGNARQECQVHAEGLVGHLAAAGNFVGEVLRSLLRQAGDDAQSAGIRHRGRQLGEADEMHAALNDGVFDAEEFGDAGFHDGDVLEDGTFTDLKQTEHSVSFSVKAAKPANGRHHEDTTRRISRSRLDCPLRGGHTRQGGNDRIAERPTSELPADARTRRPAGGVSGGPERRPRRPGRLCRAQQRRHSRPDLRTWRLGGIVLALNFRLTAPELDFIIGDAAPKVVLYDSELAEIVAPLRASGDVGLWLETHGDGRDSAFDRAIAEASGCVSNTIEQPLEAQCMLMYSSGTTGMIPKGVIITRGMLAFSAMAGATPGLTSRRSVSLAAMPLFHIAGMNVCCMPAATMGATTVLMRASEPAAVLAAISDADLGVTHFFAVPAAYNTLAQHPDALSADYSRLVTALSGAETVPELLVAWWLERGVAIQEGYGLTETAAQDCLLAHEEVRNRPGCAGKPLVHSRMKIMVDKRPKRGRMRRARSGSKARW